MARKRVKGFKEVPIGVKIISVLYYIGAVLILILGILMIPGWRSTFFREGYIIIGIFFIALAVFIFFVGRSFWKCQKWARISAIVLTIIGIVISILELTVAEIVPRLPARTISNIIFLIVNIVIGSYLWFSKDVKAAFS